MTTPAREDSRIKGYRDAGPYPIRHPACVPLHAYEIPRPFAPPLDPSAPTLGGLRFSASRPLQPGATAEVCVEIGGETRRFRGVVHWVRPAGRRFEIALRLTDPEQAFRARMVEQASHIEAYRHRVARGLAGPLGLDQAAARWIERYARLFAEAWERPVTG